MFESCEAEFTPQTFPIHRLWWTELPVHHLTHLLICHSSGPSNPYYGPDYFTNEDPRACNLDNIRNYGTPHENYLQSLHSTPCLKVDPLIEKYHLNTVLTSRTRWFCCEHCPTFGGHFFENPQSFPMNSKVLQTKECMRMWSLSASVWFRISWPLPPLTLFFCLSRAGDIRLLIERSRSALAWFRV